MRFFGALLGRNFTTGIIAVFTGLFGFYITNVVESLRSSYTAVHYFEPHAETKTVVFHLVNVSRNKRVEAARFIIKCADQAEDCFVRVPGTDPSSPVSEVTTPPNFGRQIDSSGSGPAAVRVCLGAIASSRTSVRVAPKGGENTPLIALYDPWSSDCAPANTEATNLLLLAPDDPHAFFVQHYFTVVTIALAVSALILAVTGLGMAARDSRKKKEVPDEESGDQVEKLVFFGYRIRSSDDGTGK